MKAFRNRAGFTLLELLVVIVILSILAALATVGVNAALSASRANSTEAMIGTISGALASYRTRWGDYPPSSVDGLGGRAPNEINNGIEALVACLSSRKRGGVLYQPPGDESFGNTDRDKASANLTDWYFGDNELREYRDFFGFTLIYLHHRDYARPRPAVLKYRLTEDGEELTVAPEQSSATKTFVNPDRFQLRSVGGDGKPGTSDDIR
ncbi:MAG TPA: prepilin-type N-terminal cleavage/methylation domain-containing protein [Planctomycetota bacterium]|nr:prepilin-type N-terminal cleavage/methylation domain-containing protein [Planctomycetota bacterium]